MNLVKQPKNKQSSEKVELKRQRDNVKAEYTAKTKILLKASMNVPMSG